MAGHSHFANVKHKKDAQDKKKAKIFTKIQRNILVAAKSGSADVDTNPKLKAAVAEARNMNMPKDRIEAAIKKAFGLDSNENYEEIRYNGYGSGGVAIIVECLTDNKNRTAGEVRAVFTKHAGSLGETGSVEFMFDKIGLITYAKKGKTYDEVFDIALEAGALDIEEDEDSFLIVTNFSDMHNISNVLQNSLGEYTSIRHSWNPHNTIAPTPEQQINCNKIIDALEDLDDVQEVYHNLSS